MSRILLRRSNTAGNDAYTGSLGEITFDTQLRKLRLHDGATAGGHTVANMADITALQGQIDGLTISDIANLQSALDAITGDISTIEGDIATLQDDVADRIPLSQKGANNGVATLDGSGKVPTAQLPSFVDDVIEAADFASLPATGETGKIYITLDDNKTYRWSGSAYVYITSGAVDSVNGKTGIVVLNKSDVGLGNVNNTSDLNKPISTATQTALNLKAPLASPALTGTPTAPTPITSDDSTRIATTAFVKDVIDALSTGVASVSVSAPITNTGTAAQPIIGITNATTSAAGAMSAADKVKLDGIEAGAEANDVTSVAGKTGAVTLVKADVGLANVQNYGMASNADAATGTSLVKYMSPGTTKHFIENGDYIIDCGTF